MRNTMFEDIILETMDDYADVSIEKHCKIGRL